MANIIKELSVVPAERTLKVIGGRWKVFVLHFLFEGPKRLSELRRLIPGVSQKVLVQQLREMEEHGVVHREVFAEVPPRVVYTLTRTGSSLRPILATLCQWGRQHVDQPNETASNDKPSNQKPAAKRKPVLAARTKTRPRVAARG